MILINLLSLNENIMSVNLHEIKINFFRIIALNGTVRIFLKNIKLKAFPYHIYIYIYIKAESNLELA
jgi:hypothetical protein